MVFEEATVGRVIVVQLESGDVGIIGAAVDDGHCVGRGRVGDVEVAEKRGLAHFAF